MAYIGRSTDGFGVRNRFIYLASSGDTSVSGADANGATLTFTDGAYVDVYLNGVLLKAGTDYNTSTAGTIAGLSALNTNDEVTVIVYDIFTVADTVSATSGGTFSGGVTANAGITMGGSTPTLTIGDAGAEDTKIVFDGNAQDYHIGLDDSADTLNIGKGSALGTTTAMTIDANGHILKPLQPLFEVTSSTTQSISNSTLTKTTLWDTKVHDQNSDFDTSTDQFTAPVAGSYLMTCTLTLSTMVAGSGIGIVWKKQSTGGSMDIYKHPYHQSTEINITHTLTATTIMTLAAGDAIELHVFQGSGSAESLTNANVYSGSNSSSQNWQGFLIG